MGELSWSVDPILTLALSLKEREFWSALSRGDDQRPGKPQGPLRHCFPGFSSLLSWERSNRRLFGLLSQRARSSRPILLQIRGLSCGAERIDSLRGVVHHRNI